MVVGFIGFGEAASSMAAGLNEEKVDRIVCFDAMQEDPRFKEKTAERRDKACAEKCETAADVCRQADIVFSATPSNFAVAAAKGAIDGVGEGLLFVDVSTATPKDKQSIAEMVEAKGGVFTDGAMLGALLKDRHKVPMLLSGTGAQQVRDLMTPYKMRMEVVEGGPGVATSIKFIRSITAKGVSTLIFESLQAAQKLGVEQTIVDSIVDSFGPKFLDIINGYLSGVIIHAERREHEMENVVDFLKSESLPYSMADATREKIAWIREEGIKGRFSGDVPRNWEGVLAEWGMNS